MIQTHDGYAQVEAGDTGADLVFAAVQGQVLRYLDIAIESFHFPGQGDAREALGLVREKVVAMVPTWIEGAVEGRMAVDDETGTDEVSDDGLDAKESALTDAFKAMGLK